MRNKIWTRVWALCLAAACLIGAVGAVELVWDLDGSGKTDVWDLQLAVNWGKTAEEKAAALTEVLGGADELHKNAAGVYEIYSALGLYNMAKHASEGASFKLMQDIDMQGMDWTPITNFKGHFDGQGHTISNMNITKPVGINLGFFAESNHIDANTQSTIKNLNLADVNITVTENDVEYVGLLIGTNRGIVENCTTIGSVTDSRTFLEKKAYIGTLAGRNANSTPAGKIVTGTDLLTATAGSSNPNDQVTGVTSKMAMDFAQLEEGSAARTIGIAGYSEPANLDTAAIWQDISNDSSRLSETEQARRQGAVDKMYEMGTVQWTTSELIYYTAAGNIRSTHSNAYIPGTTYTGIPYNGEGGSMERFLSQMQEAKDSEGRYVTVTGLEDGQNADGVTGFIRYMGNDCSSAIAWAWAAVSPSRLQNSGVRVNTTPNMVPNEFNTANYGVLPAGGYQVLETNAEKYANGIDARDTRSIIELNGGAQGMAEYYAKSHVGDALLFVEYELDTATDTWTKDGGHARLLAEDPVIIRDHKGVIDLSRSYVITHEQGDGLYDNRNASGSYDTHNGYNVKQTSWRTNYKYTLSVLLTEEGYNAATLPGCGYGYVPVTIPAYTVEGALRTPYYDPGYTTATNYHPVELPNSGWYYSNYMTISSTMTITDGNGQELYNKTAYLLDCRGSGFQTVKLELGFPDATEDLVEGQTYYCTIKMLAADGTVTTEVNNQAFTYTGASAE